MKNVYGYIRVSTVKQGEKGVSLQEQRDSIERFAKREGLQIVFWFEERETAAKRGRPIFNQMINLLRKGKADGVIIHKIDRGARNLKDWAEIGELSDQGINIHCANETLDLSTRGGRLSADIQAVVAADYIRNLREETRKGFYGRIKQGLYPLPAPLGYLDKGKGQVKVPDPASANLVRRAFELYATGRYQLKSLLEELHRLGLRNRKGRKLSMTGLSTILNNPFYTGLIRLHRTGETFPGSHEPLVPQSLFDRVQRILRGKTNARSQRHDFVFRRLLACKLCGHTLTGETQKQHTYYRCHQTDCSRPCVREEKFDNDIRQKLLSLQLSAEESRYIDAKLTTLREEWKTQSHQETESLRLRVTNLQDRLGRLTDAYIDRMIEKDAYEGRKAAVLMEKKRLEESLTTMEGNGQSVPDRVTKFFELLKETYSQYDLGEAYEKRELLKIVTSNRMADDENVEMTLSPPFDEVANRFEFSNGAPYRDRLRTWDKILLKLADYFKDKPAPALTREQDT
ncbi:MAG: recombinase family protein [Acidobacteriia bacterium]|nr:recombinase family protein [Terriglobia bacterium]